MKGKHLSLSQLAELVRVNEVQVVASFPLDELATLRRDYMLQARDVPLNPDSWLSSEIYIYPRQDILAHCLYVIMLEEKEISIEYKFDFSPPGLGTELGPNNTFKASALLLSYSSSPLYMFLHLCVVYICVRVDMCVTVECLLQLLAIPVFKICYYCWGGCQGAHVEIRESNL